MFTSIRPLIFSMLIVALGISLGMFGIVTISRFIGPIPFSMMQTTTAIQSTFDVTGESKVTTIPDKAVVNLGVIVNESTVKATQDKANTIITAITDGLTKLGIDKKDIKTENYSLYPNYDYQQGQKITGYTINASLSVSVTDFSTLNQAIDAATAAGANQVGGVSFTLSDDKRKSVEDDARKQAIDDAKTKAQTLARLAGMHLGKIVNITEQPSNRPYPVPMMYKGIADTSATNNQVPTTTEPGTTTLNYSVTLSYETL